MFRVVPALNKGLLLAAVIAAPCLPALAQETATAADRGTFDGDHRHRFAHRRSE